jgi:hypothetical protein
MIKSLINNLRSWLSWYILPSDGQRGFQQLIDQVAIYHEDINRFQRDTGDSSIKSLGKYWEMRTGGAGVHTGFQEGQLRESTLSDEIDEPGWRRLAPTYYAGIEDLAVVRQDAVRASRYYALRDPLLHRAVWLVIRYVWGRGIIGPKAKDDQVQSVIDSLVNDGDNDLLFRPTGQWELSQTLIEDGEIFLTAFVNAYSGHTKFSYVSTDEIEDVIVSPENRRKPIYYKRNWSPQVWSWSSGSYTTPGIRTDYWPDWSAPETSLENDHKIYACSECGAGVTNHIQCSQCGKALDLREAESMRLISHTGTEHATVGDPFTRMYMHQYKVNSRGQRGLPAFYSAIPYVKAYKGFIEDRTVLLIALATFAFKQNVTGNQSQITRMANQWGSTIFGRYGYNPSRRTDRERAPAARVLINNDAANVEQMQVDTGATNAYQDGRITRQQVAAGTDITEPDLTGDPSVGNLASMTAMNGPQLKGFEWWQQIFETIVEESTAFAIRMAVIHGDLTRLDDDGNERDLSFEVDFPPIVESDLPGYIGAVAQLISAQSLSGKQYIAPERVARYILQVFGEKDIDKALAELDFDGDILPDGLNVPADGFPDRSADQIEALRIKIEEALGD